MIYEYNGSNIADGLYYFYASWNSNCNTIKERIKKLDKQYNINIYRVNTTKYNKIKKELNILRIPCYMIIKNNEVINYIGGNVDFITLNNWLKENLK